MADKLQDTTKIDTIPTAKSGLVTDLNDSYVDKEKYTHARNLIKNSKDGDIGSLGNEPSTIMSYSAPYKIIGIVKLPDDKDLVFSTDNKNSEIGLGDLTNNTYEKIINNTCLNFNTDYPIIGKARKDFNKNTIAYITDKYNPYRRIDLSKLSKLKDCDEILLFKNIQQPCLSTKKSNIGNLPNGSYSIAIAYTVDKKIFSDWYSITNRQLLYSENNSNAIEVNISQIDTEFDEFALCLVANYIDPVTKGATKTAKIVGYYSTKTKSVAITDFLNTQYENIPLESLVTKKETWQKGGILTSNSNLLLLGDLVKRKEEDYQLKAMSINIEYVVTQVPLDYYENDGEDIGFYRDENYDFFIQGVYKSGELTDKYHIPGRLATGSDKSIVSNADVFELDKNFSTCNEEKIEKWQVQNTAEKMIGVNENFKCDRRVIGKGKMGYFESKDLYPDNISTFGKDANKPIRYHKMPDEQKVPRYSIVDGKTYINILGIRLKNIPKFSSPDIIGYKITRSDRKGGNGTVVSRGLMTNMRSYVDQQTKEEVLYSNYPVNDLAPDVFISEKQTVYKNGKETNFVPLKSYHKDKFSFYSPHTLFEPRYSIGNEIKIESEEVAEITGQFDIVHNHPKLKLLNQFSFWAALTIGALEAYYEAQGLNNQEVENVDESTFGTVLTTDGNGPGTINYGDTSKLAKLKVQGTNTTSKYTLLGLSVKSISDIIAEFSKMKDLVKKASFLKKLRLVLRLLGNLAIAPVLFTISVIRYAEEILQIINNFTNDTDYVYQYNAVAKFRKYLPIAEGHKRRGVIKSKYIPGELVSLDNKLINNFSREKTVYLELNKEIKELKTKDTSRNTISGFKLCDADNKKAKSVGSAYYVTNKVPNPNQYGALGSANTVSMHSCVLTEYTESPILYGGDCIIANMYFLKKMEFFNQNLSNANYPDGIEYDYRLYRNIGYPRFWLDSTKYNFGELFNKKEVNFSTFNRTTANKHNLDCKKSNDGKSISRIDDAYMYTSNNCAIDFICEADYNINFRELTDKPYYSNKNSNVSQIFRSDRLPFPEEFNINRVYSDLYTTEIFAEQQRKDFDPSNPIPVEQPNSVIYSLPSYNLQKIDNWQYFLPANFFNFSETDFGKLTNIQQIDQDRLMFLFSKASPFISMGRSLLELNNQTITIGDGGLFAQDPREIMPTDNNYGSSTSKYAFSNNHFGRFYPSEKQGRILNYTESLNDITLYGMSFWCKNYMPIFLYNYFPKYDKEENPISGVGYQMCFDSFYEIVYLSKRDFIPLNKEIEYKNGIFTFKGNKVELRDPRYFKDVSWTLSYSPMEKSFISWHDWHPDMIVQRDNHFSSVKDKTVWKHNESYDSFCNFYNIDYPFEIEALSTSGQQIETIRSIEYILEVYKYKNFGRDMFHLHHENFDHLIVHNTEQISPLLYLTYANPNPEENLNFPKKITNLRFDIAFFKEENKYRINQFWDTTKDRGEFTNNEYHLFPTDESGYKNVINPVAVDTDKPEEERKKFRHYFTKFRFIKSKSGENKFLFKILNIKKLLSQR